jgi:transaldolase
MLYLDSADLDQVETAAGLGVVDGVTTNPSLMRQHTNDPLAHLGRLLERFPGGPVFYQPAPDRIEQVELEARSAAKLAPNQVVVKLPANLDHIQLAARLAAHGIPCALTAVFSPGQALLAHQSGCRWIIPYVDRSGRDPSGGHDLVRRLAAILRCIASDTRILAASVKTVGQALAVVEDGAHEVTVPLHVIEQLAVHSLTEQAIADFGHGRDGRASAGPSTLIGAYG